MTGLLSKSDLERIDDSQVSELEQQMLQLQKEYEEKLKAIEAERKAKEEEHNKKEKMLNLYSKYESELGSPEKLVAALKENKDDILNHVIIYFGLQGVSKKRVLTELVSMFDKPIELKGDKAEIAKLFNKAQGLADDLSVMADFELKLNSTSIRMKTQSQSYSYKVKNDELIYLSVYDDKAGNYNAFSLFDVVYGNTRFQYSNGVDYDTLNTLGVNLMSVVDMNGVKHWLVTYLDSKKYFVFDSLNTSDYIDGAWSYCGNVPFLTKSSYFTMLLQAVSLLLTDEENKKFITVLRSGFYKYLEIIKSGKTADNWFGMFQFMEVVESKTGTRNCIFRLTPSEPVCIVINKERTVLLSKALINSFITYTLTLLFGEARTIELSRRIHMFGGYDGVSQDLNGKTTDVIKLI